MTDERWIALLSFLVTALTLVSAFPPAAQYAEWFKLAAVLVSAFVGAWFGVKPAVQAARAEKK